MKLYNCKNKTYIKINEETETPPCALPCDQGLVLYFSHIDGMYSYCKDNKGNIIHPAAWTEVEVSNEEEFNSYA